MRARTRRDGRYNSIRAYARSEAGVLGAQGISERVLEAMGQTERHRFIRERSCSVAYMDAPVLIGHDQTISQPFIVALMTHLAAVKSDDTVLEVGTGSGYQTAVLARLVRKVCTVEIIPPLAEAAAKVLRELGYDNVSIKVGDGYLGWPECGPFDAMIVTAALDHVPPPHVGLCVADWSIAGKGPEGKDVKLGGTSAEVVRKTSAGNWVYVIDSPYGTA